MLCGGTQYKCFISWADEARAQRDERDAALRAQLMKKGSVLGVRVVQAWFAWNAQRRAARRRIGWGVSAAGKAFRSWLLLIDAKRRREFLEWALGPNMSHLQSRRA